MSDVAARLSDGAAAVAATVTYVAACAAVGRRHPDLTPHLVGEAYFAETGLRLSALDADIRAVASAAAAAEEALRIERQALEILSQGWGGQSGSAAAEFVTRQCAAAAMVTAALHDAAEVLIRLRRSLAVGVDRKVDTTVRIGDRADRPVWDGAAESVLRGRAGDPEQAVVTRWIAPYISTDIGGEWLAAMRSGSEAVAAAYRQAATELAELPLPSFEIAAPPLPSVARPARPPPGARCLTKSQDGLLWPFSSGAG